MSPESLTIIASIVTTIVGVLTLIITNFFATKKLKITLEQATLKQEKLEKAKLEELKLLREQARLDREQDRLDRIADRDLIMSAGDSRKDEIVQQVKQVKTVALKAALKSEEAVRVSNGYNEKIVSTVEIAKEALEKLNNPNA